MQLDVAGMPDALNTTPSGCVAPEATTTPPAGTDELAQPRPKAPLLPHGHGVVCCASMPSPAQNAPNATAGAQSTTKPSHAAFVSPATSIVASPQKAVNRPSGVIEGSL